MEKFDLMTLAVTNRLLGLLFLLMGGVTFAYPEIFTSFYGMVLPTPESRVAIRAIIGGGELSLAVIFVMGGLFGYTEIARVRLALIIFLGVISARTAAILIEGTYNGTLLRELAIEICILLVLGFLSRKSR